MVLRFVEGEILKKEKCMVCQKNEALWDPGLKEFVPCLDCLKEKRRVGMEHILNRSLQRSGIPKRFLEAKLQDFKKPTCDLNPNTGFLVTGPVGCGKTHLLAALARELILDSKQVLFVQSSTFLKRVRNEIQGSKTDLIEKAISVPFLFLDDFGTEKVTDWVYETWFTLLNERYSECRYISVSANSPDTLDGRLFRRIIDMTLLVDLPERFG